MVYPPREDTELLLKNTLDLELERKTLLEVGTGSGKIAVEAARHGAEVTAVDIDPYAVEAARHLAEKEAVEIEVFQSDLFQNVNDQFDIVVFNPPYLPGERDSEEDALVGGETGLEITRRFLETASDYLTAEGVLMVVISDHTDYSSLVEEFDLEEVDSVKLWFETLYLFRKG